MQVRQPPPLAHSCIQLHQVAHTHTGAAGLLRQACTQMTQGYTGCKLQQQQPKPSRGPAHTQAPQPQDGDWHRLHFEAPAGSSNSLAVTVALTPELHVLLHEGTQVEVVGKACVSPNLQQQAALLVAEQAFVQRQMSQAVAGNPVVEVLHVALRC